MGKSGSPATFLGVGALLAATGSWVFIRALTGHRFYTRGGGNVPRIVSCLGAVFWAYLGVCSIGAAFGKEIVNGKMVALLGGGTLLIGVVAEIVRVLVRTAFSKPQAEVDSRFLQDRPTSDVSTTIRGRLPAQYLEGGWAILCGMFVLSIGLSQHAVFGIGLGIAWSMAGLLWIFVGH